MLNGAFPEVKSVKKDIKIKKKKDKGGFPVTIDVMKER